ncbi:hypothetical protein [Flavobacterium selenitireducens]|uniref:hypothetical protein n=1 Tax=Flavobacterium selenitireducens TaxID=2722704 RepID=UPI00168B4137|nr:hypothetical protein [Flavobacterium selenitireducens]MBD3583855.1 hypothetical protein [Flavobacterium selenitireducens]
MKSIIKLLGLSIGCSCTALQAQQTNTADFSGKDSIILTTVVTDEQATLSQPLASLQDIGKLYAL